MRDTPLERDPPATVRPLSTALTAHPDQWGPLSPGPESGEMVPRHLSQWGPQPAWLREEASWGDSEGDRFGSRQTGVGEERVGFCGRSPHPGPLLREGRAAGPGPSEAEKERSVWAWRPHARSP